MRLLQVRLADACGCVPFPISDFHILLCQAKHMFFPIGKRAALFVGMMLFSVGGLFGVVVKPVLHVCASCDVHAF